MSLKVKQMICPEHGQVLAVKNGHGIRNAVAIASLPVGGVGILAARVEGWKCPHCGGRCSARLTTRRRPIRLSKRAQAQVDAAMAAYDAEEVQA